MLAYPRPVSEGGEARRRTEWGKGAGRKGNVRGKGGGGGGRDGEGERKIKEWKGMSKAR